MKTLGNKKIGVIGVGNMGSSILEGVISKGLTTPQNIFVFDKDAKKLKDFAKKTRVNLVSSTEELIKKSDVVLIAMKPQDFAVFASENKKFWTEKKWLISILAGMTIAKIKAAIGEEISIVRAMPNLGAKVGAGMTAVSSASKQALLFSKVFFSGCGEVAILDEKHLDLVTALSGSGPAYFFYMMELMEEFGIQNGLHNSVARLLAIQTGIGAALVAKSSDFSTAQLREMVTSKKGTTDAALQTLKRKKFANGFKTAMKAAMTRSRELRKGK